MGLFSRRDPGQPEDPGPPGICPHCWDSKRLQPHCANGKCRIWRCHNCRHIFTKDPHRCVDKGLVPPWQPPAAGGPFIPPAGFTDHPTDPNDRLVPPPPKEMS